MILKFFLSIEKKAKLFLPKAVRIKFRRLAWTFKRAFNRFAARRYGKQMANFLHIGKTGGNAFTGAVGPHVTTDKFLIEIHPHRSTLGDIPKGEKVFFFLRDPINRFVSGFNSRKRKGQPINYVPWTPDEAVAFGRFHSPNELALALSADDQQLRQAAEKAMRDIEHVRSFYWDWFNDREYFLSRASDILFFGFQERLAEDFEILKKLLGLPESVRLPDDDVKAHRAPADSNRYLDEQAISNLKVWYTRDYEFIKICQEILKK